MNSADNVLFDIVIPMAKYKHVDKAMPDRTTKSGNFIAATPRREYLRLALINTIHKWFRHQKTEVKNNYKELLTEFYIPEPRQEYRSCTIEYIIHRHTKAKLDSDGIIFSVKWFTDVLVESGHLTDDDQVTHVLKPSVYINESTETQLRVIVKTV